MPATTRSSRLLAAPLAALALPAALAAQSAAPSASAASAPAPRLAEVSGLEGTTFFACYVPSSGTTYRIKTADTKPACASPTHVEFSWTVGGPPSGAAAGDLTGSYPAPTVVGLQGRAVLNAAPASGNVLAWNGTAWAPAAPAAGGGSPFALPYSGSATSTDTLFKVRQLGAGVAASFRSLDGPAGVAGVSGIGAGVHGTAVADNATSAGVRAENLQPNGTALEITRGEVRVKGAGLNTNTAVFYTRASDMTPDCFTYLALGYKTCTYVIDHPMTNDAPGAILIVTPRSISVKGAYAPEKFYVRYSAGLGRWTIEARYDDHLSDQPGAGESDATLFNILVVKP